MSARLDELVSGDLTGLAAEPSQAVPAVAALADVCGYDEHKRGYALRLGAGVGIIILGVALGALLEGMTPQPLNPDAGSAVASLSCIAAGLGLIITAAYSDSAFQKAHPFIEDFYTAEQKGQAQKAFGRDLAIGIGSILAGVAVGAMARLTLLPRGLPALRRHRRLHRARGISSGRLDVEEYNIDALSELTEEEVASIVGEERAAKVLARVRRNRLIGSICGIIMLVASIVGLVLMFWGMYEQNFFGEYFWLAWCIGGLLCAIVSIVMGLAKKE